MTERAPLCAKIACYSLVCSWKKNVCTFSVPCVVYIFNYQIAICWSVWLHAFLPYAMWLMWHGEILQTWTRFWSAACLEGNSNWYPCIFRAKFQTSLCAYNVKLELYKRSWSVEFSRVLICANSCIGLFSSCQ